MELTDVLSWAWAVIGGYALYLNRKIDRVAEDRIARTEFNGVIQSLRNEIHDGNNAITGRLDALLTTLLNQKMSE